MQLRVWPNYSNCLSVTRRYHWWSFFVLPQTSMSSVMFIWPDQLEIIVKISLVLRYPYFAPSQDCCSAVWSICLQIAVGKQSQQALFVVTWIGAQHMTTLLIRLNVSSITACLTIKRWSDPHWFSIRILISIRPLQKWISHLLVRIIKCQIWDFVYKLLYIRADFTSP